MGLVIYRAKTHHFEDRKEYQTTQVFKLDLAVGLAVQRLECFNGELETWVFVPVHGRISLFNYQQTRLS